MPTNAASAGSGAPGTLWWAGTGMDALSGAALVLVPRFMLAPPWSSGCPASARPALHSPLHPAALGPAPMLASIQHLSIGNQATGTWSGPLRARHAARAGTRSAQYLSEIALMWARWAC